jgi:hypothetical protein
LIHGYTRPEARKWLGIEDEARMQKLMDRATKKIGGIVASIDARGCGDDEWARLLRAYALGLLGENGRDYRRARDHIEDCAPCRHYVLGLRGLAAVMPPVVVRLSPLDGHGSSVLAHLQHIFRGHPAAGASSAVQTTTTAGGTSAAGGGAGLVGSLGGVKTAAAFLAAAAASVTAIHVSDTHHHLAMRHAHAGALRKSAFPARPLYPPVTFAAPIDLANERSKPTQRAAPSDGAASRAPRTVAVEREFGIEGRRASSVPSSSPVGRVSASVASRTSHPVANVSAVEREFGLER